MKQNKRVIFLLLILVMILCAYTNVFSAGRGAFAGDSVGARPSVFGESFVALADDANAIRWNPAGLANLLQPEFTSSHINFFSMGGYVDYSNSGSINEDFIGFAIPNHIAPVGISFLNLGTSGMPIADENGAIIDSFGNYSERTFTVSAGKRFRFGKLGLLSGLCLNRYSVGGASDSSGFGMDGGLLLETPGILPKIGIMMSGFFMDTTLGDNGLTIPAKTDLAISFSPSRSFRLMSGLGKTSGDSLAQYSAGLEYVFHQISPLHISLMAGYKTLGKLNNQNFESSASSWATGASMRISRYKIDYSYEQHSLLGHTHRISVSIFKDSLEDFHLNKGRRAFEQLDDNSAIRELDNAIYLAPRVQAYHTLALTYERMRDREKAIQALQKIQSLNYDYFIEQKLDQLIKDIQEQE